MEPISLFDQWLIQIKKYLRKNSRKFKQFCSKVAQVTEHKNKSRLNYPVTNCVFRNKRTKITINQANKKSSKDNQKKRQKCKQNVHCMNINQTNSNKIVKYSKQNLNKTEEQTLDNIHKFSAKSRTNYYKPLSFLHWGNTV